MKKEGTIMDYQKLADLLFPDVTVTIDEVEARFPQRDLPEGAQVTRMGPSPTGFIHLGNLYSALADERIAHQSGGVFYLRIEDTDNKRKVEGAVDIIISVLRYFGIEFDQGAGIDTEESNVYGPYFQRQRADIYHVYAKDLVARGLAYPCFCTEEEIADIKEQQKAQNVITGYHTTWTRCRDLSYETIEERIKAGMPYVLRLRSQGEEGREIIFRDQIRGSVKFPENIMDVVLLKRDGIPTYHFAHAIDDHLMHTTMVIRGEEWLSSVPTHVELHKVLGFRLPKYAHTAHLMKMENGGKRKLSKRKDPELSLDYYRKDGYHPQGVKVYLMTLLNSSFEQWYDKHPNNPITDFKYSVKKMSKSGALFDIMKLNDICKNEFSKLEPEEVYDFLYTWVETYHPDMLDVYFSDKEKFIKILELGMGVGSKRRRKDYINAKQIMSTVHYYFDETYQQIDEQKYDDETVKAVLTAYLEKYDHNDDANTWFGKIKEIGESFGFTGNMREYKKNPEAYKGNVSHIAEIIRIATVGQASSPDQWTIYHIMGEDMMRRRVEAFLNK